MVVCVSSCLWAADEGEAAAAVPLPPCQPLSLFPADLTCSPRAFISGGRGRGSALSTLYFPLYDVIQTVNVFVLFLVVCFC